MIQATLMLLSVVYVLLTLAADLVMRGSIRASGWADMGAAMPLPWRNEPGRRTLFWRRVRGHAGLLIGAGLLLAVVFVALFAGVLSPHDPYAQDLGRRLVPPIWHDAGNWAHPLGHRQPKATTCRAACMARASRC